MRTPAVRQPGRVFTGIGPPGAREPAILAPCRGSAKRCRLNNEAEMSLNLYAKVKYRALSPGDSSQAVELLTVQGADYLAGRSRRSRLTGSVRAGPGLNP